jgi:hypothetical protein
MSLVLNVEILGEFKNLTKATQGSQSELEKLNGKISGFSSSAKKAFASIGVGLSFALIARELGDATKAAVEDRKSSELLAEALRKTTDATDDQIASVEKQITKTSLMAGIADDKLRPAYATLLRSTGDLTKSTDLMNLALDISAGTGRDVESVSKALAKAVGPDGTTGALEKLVPAIKGANDPLGKLHDLFDGNAKLAADQDPYQRMTVVLGEIQEKVGTALLPVLDDFSAWLASPGGTEALKTISDAIVQILKDGVAVVKWAAANKDWLLPLVGGISAITGTWKAATTAVGLYNAAAAIAAGYSAKGALPTGAGAKPGAVPGLPGALAAATAGVSILLGGADLVAQKEAAAGVTSKGLSVSGGGFVSGRTPMAELVKRSQPTNVTVQVNTIADAKTTIDNLSKWQKATGTTLAQALR